MKHIFHMLFLGLVLIAGAGCQEKENTADITGEWKLDTWFGQNAEQNVKVDIYLIFEANGGFELFQKIGDGHYKRFAGTYKFKKGIVSGTYEKGKPWSSSYTAVVNGNLLTMTMDSTGEICTYSKTAVPDSVRKDAEDYN